MNESDFGIEITPGGTAVSDDERNTFSGFLRDIERERKLMKKDLSARQ